MLFFSITDHKRRVQQWSYKQNFLLLNYSAHLFLDVHCSSKVKKNYFVFTLWLDFFFFFFFLLLPHFYPLLLSPLNRSSHSSFLPVASFKSSTRRQPKPLPSPDNAEWSLLSHFSSTLSLNLSPSQTPRPMIAGARF